MTKYSILTRKMMRGVVLDLPSKGKTSETIIVEGMMSMHLSSPLQGPAKLVVI